MNLAANFCLLFDTTRGAFIEKVCKALYGLVTPPPPYETLHSQPSIISSEKRDQTRKKSRGDEQEARPWGWSGLKDITGTLHSLDTNKCTSEEVTRGGLQVDAVGNSLDNSISQHAALMQQKALNPLQPACTTCFLLLPHPNCWDELLPIFLFWIFHVKMFWLAWQYAWFPYLGRVFLTWGKPAGPERCRPVSHAISRCSEANSQHEHAVLKQQLQVVPLRVLLNFQSTANLSRSKILVQLAMTQPLWSYGHSSKCQPSFAELSRGHTREFILHPGVVCLTS